MQKKKKNVKKKKHEIKSFICNNAAHDVILCDLGY